MTLVYENTTCKQSIFTLTWTGQNLNKDNIVFTVKKLISNFKQQFPLLFKEDYKKEGRPKEYYLDELLGFIVYGVYNNRYSCRSLANWINNNDESVNYILNNKKPKKSTIHLFLQEHALLINAFFHYTIKLGIGLGLIDGECISVDGTIVKAHANNFHLIRIEEIEYLQELILLYGQNWTKNSIWFKLHNYYNNNEEKPEIQEIINKIKTNLKKNSIKLLRTALTSMDKMYYVLDLLEVLKANYDGKHTISLTDPESRWMLDKQKNNGLNYNYQVAIDSKNSMVVGQYLTQNATDAKELYEMLNEIKIKMDFNPQIVVADNGYMDDNVLKYAHENNIRLLIPDRNESIKTKPKIKRNLMPKLILNTIGKKIVLYALLVKNCIIKMTEHKMEN